ncbi:hypothetical protein BDN72DRAFT_905611 [Pluteus cervinus]|uniref:Uncharacterized protein n=1 Tax=Pluteus cervinus TaxID=181527 RepID=A0ACD3A1W0_9AGAR|nr:hypothetical protein BDN72DRAFT_905611 [Pluteus cervinus]
MDSNPSTTVRRSTRPRKPSKRYIEGLASGKSTKNVKEATPPPSPPPPVSPPLRPRSATPTPGSPAALTTLPPVLSPQATIPPPTEKTNESSVPPGAEPQTVSEPTLDLVVDEVSDDEEERRALAVINFDQPAQVLESTAGDEPVASPEIGCPKPRRRTAVEQGDDVFDLRERTRKLLEDFSAHPPRRQVRTPTNVVSGRHATPSLVVPSESTPGTNARLQRNDAITEAGVTDGNGDHGSDAYDDEHGDQCDQPEYDQPTTPPVESDISESDYEGDVGDGPESGSELEEAVGHGKKVSKRKKKRTKRVTPPSFTPPPLNDTPDEETQPKTTTKKKGKAREADRPQKHTSPGPLSEAVKRKADELLATFQQAVDELAEESKHNPETIHSYLGTKLTGMRDKNFWNIYQVWYRKMRADQDEECQNAPRERWSTIISLRYKEFWQELGDLEHDEDAREAHMAPILEWYAANFHNFVEKLGEDGKMLPILHKMIKPFNDMSEQVHRTSKAHVFGFVIHPEAKGYGGFMWGGSPDFLVIRDKEKSQIDVTIRDFVMFFQKLDYDRRVGVNQPNVPYVSTQVPDEGKKSQRDIDRELLGGFLRADIVAALKITSRSQIDNLRLPFGDGWGKFAYKNHLTLMGWPSNAGSPPGQAGSTLKSLDKDLLKTAVAARIQLQNGETVTAEPLLQILKWQPDVLTFALEAWKDIPIVCGPTQKDVIMKVGEVQAYKDDKKKEILKAAKLAKKQAKTNAKHNTKNRQPRQRQKSSDLDDDEERPITPPPQSCADPYRQSPYRAAEYELFTYTGGGNPRPTQSPSNSDQDCHHESTGEDEHGQYRGHSIPPLRDTPRLPSSSERFNRTTGYPTEPHSTVTRYDTSSRTTPRITSQSVDEHRQSKQPTYPPPSTRRSPDSDSEQDDETKDSFDVKYNYQAQRNPPLRHFQPSSHEVNYSQHASTRRPIAQRANQNEDCQPPPKRQRHESTQLISVNHPPPLRQPVPHLDLNNLSKFNRHRSSTQTPRPTPAPQAGPSRLTGYSYENRTHPSNKRKKGPMDEDED